MQEIMKTKIPKDEKSFILYRIFHSFVPSNSEYESSIFFRWEAQIVWQQLDEELINSENGFKFWQEKSHF